MAKGQMQDLIPGSTSSVVTIPTQTAISNQMQYGVLDHLSQTQLQGGDVPPMAAVKTDMESMQYQLQNQATQLQGGCLPPIAVAITEPDIQQTESGVSPVQLQSGQLLPLSTVRTESMPFDGMSAVAVTKTETMTLHNSGTVQARGDIIPFQVSVQNYRSTLACVSETAQTACDLKLESSNVKSCVQDLAVPFFSNHTLPKHTTPLLPHEQKSNKMTTQQQMTEAQQHTSYPSQLLFQHCVPQQPQHDLLTHLPVSVPTSHSPSTGASATSVNDEQQ